ncbi:MAG: hypothetical protein RLY16_2237, partial [Bacteroidota bacterium]
HRDTRFIVIGYDQFGCKGTDTVDIKIFAQEGYYVPNAFSPNGDGLNEIFRVIPAGIMQTDFFSIYNRYGELIFQTSNLDRGWDGTYKGRKQEPGNYVWVLQGKGNSGKRYQMKGNVILVR